MRLSDAADVEPGHPAGEARRDALDAAAGAGHAVDLGPREQAGDD
jgi:hypothetical protein